MNIYKYPVPIEDNFTIEMPINSKILSFQEQNEKLQLWALVNHDNAIEKKKFVLRGTGYEINWDLVLRFVGTVQVMDGKCVWHLFEMK